MRSCLDRLSDERAGWTGWSEMEMKGIMTSKPKLFALFILAGLVSVVAGPRSWACPFCDAPTTTLGEQLHSAQVAVMARWVSGEKPEGNDFAEGTSTYQVTRSAGVAKADFPPGTHFKVNRYRASGGDEELLFFASLNGEELQWGLPVLTSHECWDYLVNAPERNKPHVERIPYYLASLEHGDPDIAMDAYGEFARIDYSDLKAVADQLPREKIREWLKSEETIPTRKGLYGLMLGLCGNSDDARMLGEIIRQQPEIPRMGIDGMMAGYLLLTRQEGLDQLRKWKLDDPATPESELFSVMKALEFLWTYGQDKVDASQVRLMMRSFVDRPQFTSLAIINLARWQDWELIDRLVSGYGTEPFADAHVRQTIVRFLTAAEKNAGVVPIAGQEVDVKAKAKAALETIRANDPRTVRYVERYPLD